MPFRDAEIFPGDNAGRLPLEFLPLSNFESLPRFLQIYGNRMMVEKTRFERIEIIRRIIRTSGPGVGSMTDCLDIPHARPFEWFRVYLRLTVWDRPKNLGAR